MHCVSMLLRVNVASFRVFPAFAPEACRHESLPSTAAKQGLSPVLSCFIDLHIPCGGLGFLLRKSAARAAEFLENRKVGQACPVSIHCERRPCQCHSEITLNLSIRLLITKLSVRAPKEHLERCWNPFDLKSYLASAQSGGTWCRKM